MIVISESAKHALEKGRQVGATVERILGGEITWVSLAIQKYAGEYFSHVDIIKNSNISSGKYELDKTMACTTVGGAVGFIEKLIAGIAIDVELGSLKGQRIFNPTAETIIRTEDGVR